MDATISGESIKSDEIDPETEIRALRGGLQDLIKLNNNLQAKVAFDESRIAMFESRINRQRESIISHRAQVALLKGIVMDVLQSRIDALAEATTKLDIGTFVVDDDERDEDRDDD